jgi:hypothetical protein
LSCAEAVNVRDQNLIAPAWQSLMNETRTINTGAGTDELQPFRYEFVDIADDILFAARARQFRRTTWTQITAAGVAYLRDLGVQWDVSHSWQHAPYQRGRTGPFTSSEDVLDSTGRAAGTRYSTRR